MNLSLAQKEIYDLPLTLVMIAHANFQRTITVLLHDSWRFRKINITPNPCQKPGIVPKIGHWISIEPSVAENSNSDI